MTLFIGGNRVMIKDDRLALAVKNTTSPLRLFRSIKDRYESMALGKIQELKQLGLRNIELDGVHPRITYEMTNQLCKLIKQYGCYVDWFGTTQALFEVNYKGELEQNINNCIAEKRLSSELAGDICLENIKRGFISEKEYARYFHEFELNFKEGSIPINAITVNLKNAKSYKELHVSLKQSVKYKFLAPYCDTPSSNSTHECTHNFFLYLKDMDALNHEIGRVVHYVFETSAEELCEYGKDDFEEFVAEAFTESHHSPEPREIAKLVRLWIDTSFAELRSKASMKNAIA